MATVAPVPGSQAPKAPAAGKGPHKQQQQQQRPGSSSRPPGGGHAQRPKPPGGGGRAAAAAAAGAAAATLPPNELESRLRRDTPFICHIKFKNDLPEIPADPKLLLTRPQPEALSSFAVTSLEQQALRGLLLPGDLGVPITLLDAERYNAPPQGKQGPLDPKDQALLEAEVRLPGQGPSPAKARRVAGKGVEVSWLMRTTYISSTDEGGGARRAGATKATAEDAAEATREVQMRDIEASFAAAQQPITHHPKKRGVVATEVLPVLPDLEQWPHKYIQVSFDEEPTTDGLLASVEDTKLRRQLADRCMLKTYNLAQGEGDKQLPALALLVPKAGLEAARAGDAEGLPAEQGVDELEGDYLWDHEYTWSQLRRREDDQAQDAYLMRRMEDKVSYCMFAMKLRCRKRKRRAEDDPIPAKVTFTNRELTQDEEEEQMEAKHPDA